MLFLQTGKKGRTMRSGLLGIMKTGETGWLRKKQLLSQQLKK